MSYYNEGFDSAQSGLNYKHCPYSKGTAGYTYWNNGWIDATREKTR